MGYDSTRIMVLLNRADTRIGISREDVTAIVGRKPDVFVPSDREIPKTLTDGMPIVLADERSEAAGSFKTLAQMYADAIPKNGAPPTRTTDGKSQKTDAKEMLKSLLGRK